ncbi:hypothetical protein KI387_029986, partial [Taxus chinensis]
SLRSEIQKDFHVMQQDFLNAISNTTSNASHMGSTRNGHTDPNQSNQRGFFNHSSGSSHQWRGMIPKVEMRKFDGKDPLNWITQMENFFDLHQIPGGQK